jgi:hypothetical protein
LFADPKQSVVDIVQAAGRAMRPFPEKQFGYIVVPIIVPSGMHFSEFAETTEFGQVARVITALSAQDGRIAEELRAVGDRRRGDGRIVETSGEVPVGYRISLDEFRDKIRLKIWERVGVANWRPFDEARTFVRSLGLKTRAEWKAYRESGNRPPDIPIDPYAIYRDRGWVTWGDWLGTGTVATYDREYRPFREARAFVRRLGFQSGAEWRTYSKSGKRPPDIPSNPNTTYSNRGWAGLGDWLGTGTVATFERQYRPFREARAFVRRLGLPGQAEWQAYSKSGKRPPDIPAHPGLSYRDRGWAGFGDWLGTGTVATFDRKYRSFRRARAFVRSLGLKSLSEWLTYTRSGRLPPDIPAYPNVVYRDRGWVGLGDWLGTGILSPSERKYRPFRQARGFIRRLHWLGTPRRRKGKSRRA